MRTIPSTEIKNDPTLYSQIKEVLDSGKLVSFPTQSGYKLAADLDSPSAVTAMIQAKRRVKNAPALVFVPDVTWVDKVAANVSDDARNIMEALWPGPVTLLFKANEELHPKVRKPLTKAKGWLGVRVPQDEVALAVVKTFGRPILVSSANLSRKHGARSLAQVRKNFGRTVDLIIEDGDLAGAPNTTLVDLTKDIPNVVRAGAVPEEDIHRALTI
ncbi:MAG: threonylcarbamoyl-AMP synthase [Deltaproteobacteria bacterium]|nr:threonylcarbamoyl-AMP synthase [Deltaproteobacteria bacterium]